MNNTAPQSTKNNWHLFCKVIDNYGDIGVCWRLAQQLVGAHHKTVTLWVDNLHSFNAICPEVNPQQSWQQVCGDRKSTRLNSSHVRISYAVFCLKKKEYYIRR